MGTLHRFKLVSALVLLVILSLVSCAKTTPTPTPVPPPSPAPNPTPTPTPAPVPTPAPKQASTPTGPYGTLRFAATTFGKEKFDPILVGDTEEASYLAPLYEWLFRAKGAEPAPGVVERWEMTADGLSYTYYIRKGTKFHNGEELKADDVKFSIDRMSLPIAMEAWPGRTIDHVEMLDDYSVRIYLKSRQFYLPQMMSMINGDGSVLPKDYIERNGINYFERNPIGSGPYMFVKWVPGDLVEYEAVGNHWRQTPFFKKLEIIVVPESTTRLALLRTNEVDTTSVDVEDAADLEKIGFKTLSLFGPQVSVAFLGVYDTRAANEPTADIRVRQALSLAINRDEIGRNLFYGKMQSPMPPHLWLEQPGIDVAVWRESAAKLYTFNLDKARQLLKEAGYSNGFKNKFFTVPDPGAPTLGKMVEIIAGYWSRLGITTEIVPIDKGTFKPLARAASGPAGRGVDNSQLGAAAIFAWSGSPQTVEAVSSVVLPGSSYPLLGGATMGQDALVQAKLAQDLSTLSSSAETEDKRREATAKLIQLIVDTWIELPIGHTPSLFSYGPRLEITPPAWALTPITYVEFIGHGTQP